MYRVFKPVCLVIGHKRSRRRVWSDGSRWRCTCSRCGTELVKGRMHGEWRPLDHAGHDTA